MNNKVFNCNYQINYEPINLKVNQHEKLKTIKEVINRIVGTWNNMVHILHQRTTKFKKQ